MAPALSAKVAESADRASLGENGGRQRRVAPQLLSLQHHRALAVLAQHRRVRVDDRAQGVRLEPVGRVEAHRRAVADVDAAEVEDLVFGARPAEVGLAQRVDVVAGRHAVAVDPVEPIGEHQAQLRRHVVVVAKVDRAAIEAEVRTRVAQLAAPDGAFDEQAPGPGRLRARGRAPCRPATRRPGRPAGRPARRWPLAPARHVPAPPPALQ